MVRVGNLGAKTHQLANVLEKNPHLGVATLVDKSGRFHQVPGTPRVVILSDLDGTWVGKDKEALQKLNEGIKRTCFDYTNAGLKVVWGYITARPPSRTIKSGAVMPPDLSVCFNGGTIFRGMPTATKGLEMQDWARLNATSGFQSQNVLEMAKDLTKSSKFSNLKTQTVGEVVGNPDADACNYVATVCIENESIKLVANETSDMFKEESFKVPNQVKEFLSELEQKTKSKNIEYKITGPYLFSGKPYVMFDIAAPHANKGEAVNFLTKNYDHRNVIVIGDGGNDISMMDNDGRNIIVVGKDHILREKAAGLSQDSVILRPEDEPCSEGVLAGIKQHLANIAQRLKNEGVLSKDFNPELNKQPYHWEHQAPKMTSEEKMREYYA